MLSGNALNLFKLHLLQILDAYSGIEAREQQLVTDLQIGSAPNAKAEDVRQALDALKDQGHADKRLDDFRGWVWSITPDGHKTASKIALEE
jgi:transcription initiation factor IIE alpha subunit